MLRAITMLIMNKNLHATILPTICQYPNIKENLIEIQCFVQDIEWKQVVCGNKFV